MKNLLLLMVISILFGSCATSNKAKKEPDFKDFEGKSKLEIYEKMGRPSNIIQSKDGGTILVYKTYSKGMFLTPNKSNIKFYSGVNQYENDGKYFSSVSTATNDPKFTIHQTNVSYAKLYLDKNDNCFRIDQSVPKHEIEAYHERFKYFK